VPKARKILAIDDSTVALHKYKLVLLNYTVVTARNGAEGLEALSRDPEIAFIILDLQMPVMNGFEFLEAIRKEPRYRRIPVLVVSSEGATEESRRALAAGAIGHLSKPFEQRELLRLIGANMPPRLRGAGPTGHRRIPCGEPCDIVIADRVGHGLVWNMSAGGVYLVLAPPLPDLGTSVGLSFSLPGDAASIACAGRVAWVNPASSFARCGSVAPLLPAGCGMEFAGLDAGDQHRIRAVVRATSRAAREAASPSRRGVD
jgi:two-component system, chemotaxis family, chemotaxis protein CheY